MNAKCDCPACEHFAQKYYPGALTIEPVERIDSDAEISANERIYKGRAQVLILGHWINRYWLLMPPRDATCEICLNPLFPDHDQRHHRNQDRMDDRTENLQWVTWEEHRTLHKGPMKYRPAKKRKRKSVQLGYSVIICSDYDQISKMKRNPF
jgi:hypothetical protein